RPGASSGSPRRCRPAPAARPAGRGGAARRETPPRRGASRSRPRASIAPRALAAVGKRHACCCTLTGSLLYCRLRRGKEVPMLSVFTRILAGELPARFVWRDDRCAAFLSSQPLKPGHTLVVPREEVDHWLDLDPELARHLMTVSQSVGKAIQHGLRPVKVGLMIAGLEVRHVHLHLVPIEGLHDLEFARQDRSPDPPPM